MSIFYFGVFILAVVLVWCLMRAAKKGDEDMDLLGLFQGQKDASPLKPKPTSENLDGTTDSCLNIVTPTNPGFSSDKESAETMGVLTQQFQENNEEPQDERSQILSALLQTSGNKTKAAQQLHWSRMTLYRKMQKYGITSLINENFKQRLAALTSNRKLN